MKTIISRSDHAMKIRTLLLTSFFIAGSLFNITYIRGMHSTLLYELRRTGQFSSILQAIQEDDIQRVETLFERNELTQNLKDDTQRPMFFYAHTPEMAMLFIEKNIDVHAIDAQENNVLQYIVNKSDQVKLIPLYLAQGVNTEYKESCLLHLFFNYLPLENFTSHLETANILLTLMTKKINTTDIKGRTPLDIVQEHYSCQASSNEQLKNYFESVIKLMREQLGAKTSSELAQQATAKKNNSQNKKINKKEELSKNAQIIDIDDCRCIVS